MDTYYKDKRLTVVVENECYTIFDKKFANRAIHKNKTKEWTDDFISRVLNKRNEQLYLKLYSKSESSL